jgi:hypothetical protein
LKAHFEARPGQGGFDLRRPRQRHLPQDGSPSPGRVPAPSGCSVTRTSSRRATPGASPPSPSPGCVVCAPDVTIP